MSYLSRKKVIIIYSHKDAQYLERLHVHLAYYENNGLLEVWDDTKILPGTVRREELQKALSSAKVAILLISADFLASKFILEDELPLLLDTNKAEGAIILSVILSPCAFEDTTLSEFQAVNNPSRPLSKMSKHDKEQVWKDVAKYVKNATLSQHAEAETHSFMSSKNAQSIAQNRLFPRFLYRDDSVVDNLLSQLEVEINTSNNAINRFVWLYAALARQNMLQQLVKLNQGAYNDIQPGQIIEMSGRARISQWEEITDTFATIAGLSEMMKMVTGEDPWKAPDARQAYQGMTSLAAMKKPEETIIIITPLDAPRFQFVAKLDTLHMNCRKEDLKTELTVLGMVQRRLSVGETIDVFRLLPELGSLESMNRAQRRKVKKNSSTISPVDEIIKYPAVNIYPIAIY